MQLAPSHCSQQQAERRFNEKERKKNDREDDCIQKPG